MSVKTKSLFYYTPRVSIENNFIDFSEGGGNIAGEIEVSAYSPKELLDVIEATLSDLGAQEYTVSFDRVANRVTISAPGNFELNVLSGPNSGLSIYGDLGFTTNRSGTNSYTGDTSFAEEFRPQFWLQDYIPPSRWKESVAANVLESANGDVETFSFGNKEFYQLRATWITNVDQGINSPIDTDPTAVESTENFLSFVIKKSNLEFMPDRNQPGIYDKVILESTPLDSKGVGFKLMELTRKGVSGYYDTGTLVFRRRFT